MINLWPESPRRKERAQINKIRNENGDIISNTLEMQKPVREYYEQLYAKTFNNLKETDKFLETYTYQK